VCVCVCVLIFQKNFDLTLGGFRWVSLCVCILDVPCNKLHSEDETVKVNNVTFCSDTLKFTIIPLVKKMCEESLKAEDSVMVKISEQFGKLCLGLESEYHVCKIVDTVRMERTVFWTQCSWLGVYSSFAVCVLKSGE